ncbi:MAG TPA: GH25 family lysozyme [Streptosporangiaceae bacterium]|nr:GH25 family lysozyme [Streptosporangiaceae bacterium]
MGRAPGRRRLSAPRRRWLSTAPRRRQLTVAAVAVIVAAFGVAGFAAARLAPGHPEATRLPSGSAPLSSATVRMSRPVAGVLDSVMTTSRPGTSPAAGRFNAGAAHSPQLLHQLSSPLDGTGRISRAGTSAAPERHAVASPAVTTGGKSGALLQGVDVAAFQHPKSSQYPNGAPIDWTQVAGAGYKFAAIKATEGNYYTNPYYASDMAAAMAAGLYVAGYHFAIPNVGTAVGQADYAMQNAGYGTPSGPTLPLELDIEYGPSSDHTNECYGLTPSQMVSWISAFDSEVQRLTGQLPIIYTTADWWDTCTGDSTAFSSDPLWVAAYSVSSPPLPAGWPGWTLWQYTSAGTVPGIATTGEVDISYVNANPGTLQNTIGSAVSK